MHKSMTSDPRIASMLGTDSIWSVISILVLWLLYAFVFWALRDETGTPEVLWALVISGGLVILFNTAAIVAMLTHLNEARDEIYGLDIHYLDQAKAQSATN